MVTAKIIKESNIYKAFECCGHSGYADHGQDIVCAAISMLTINTANSILELSETVINPTSEEGFLSWIFDSGIDDKASLLMDSLKLGLETIEDTYGSEYLTLVIEEV